MPLVVSFAAFPAGGTGDNTFVWDFGDGGSSRNPTPGYTYENPGTFDATVRVTSASSCSVFVTSVGTAIARRPRAPCSALVLLPTSCFWTP